jgi:hypothetical protein
MGNYGWMKMESSCKITTESVTDKWPAKAKISHTAKSKCECKSMGDNDNEIVRGYTFGIAYTFYEQDKEKYNALVINDMVKSKAAKLGLDLGAYEIWDYHPECLPRRRHGDDWWKQDEYEGDSAGPDRRNLEEWLIHAR